MFWNREKIRHVRRRTWLLLNWGDFIEPSGREWISANWSCRAETESRRWVFTVILCCEKPLGCGYTQVDADSRYPPDNVSRSAHVRFYKVISVNDCSQIQSQPKVLSRRPAGTRRIDKHLKKIIHANDNFFFLQKSFLLYNNNCIKKLLANWEKKVSTRGIMDQLLLFCEKLIDWFSWIHIHFPNIHGMSE